MHKPCIIHKKRFLVGCFNPSCLILLTQEHKYIFLLLVRPLISITRSQKCHIPIPKNPNILLLKINLLSEIY